MYKVRDYGILRPKLVYNCAYVPSLCKNVQQYLGVGVTTTTLHYDRLRPADSRDDSRDQARRDTVCDGGWIDRRRTDGLAGPGSGRCPEADQPYWIYNKAGTVTKADPM